MYGCIFSEGCRDVMLFIADNERLIRELAEWMAARRGERRRVGGGGGGGGGWDVGGKGEGGVMVMRGWGGGGGGEGGVTGTFCCCKMVLWLLSWGVTVFRLLSWGVTVSRLLWEIGIVGTVLWLFSWGVTLIRLLWGYVIVVWVWGLLMVWEGEESKVLLSTGVVEMDGFEELMTVWVETGVWGGEELVWGGGWECEDGGVMVMEDEAEEDEAEDDGGAVMADGKSWEDKFEGMEAVGGGEMRLGGGVEEREGWEGHVGGSVVEVAEVGAVGGERTGGRDSWSSMKDTWKELKMRLLVRSQRR
jgi:hypothetical protein